MIVDPHMIILIKQKEHRALTFLQIPTKDDKPVQLLLPSGKALVMSSKPVFQYEGKDMKWVAIGSPSRAIDMIFL